MTSRELINISGWAQKSYEEKEIRDISGHLQVVLPT
jgi:hypothetical protein